MAKSSDKSLKAVATQINVLNSKVSLLIQKLSDLEDKFSIISRTVISHNNSIKEIQSRVDTTSGGTSGSPFSKSSEGGASSEELTDLKKDVKNIKEEIEEMKYVLDTVNPVAYVTIDDVADVVDQQLQEKGIKKKK